MCSGCGIMQGMIAKVIGFWSTWLHVQIGKDSAVLMQGCHHSGVHQQPCQP